MAKKLKKPTRGELANIKTELNMGYDAVKAKFPNDEVTVKYVGKYAPKLNLTRDSGGVTSKSKTVEKLYRPSF
jgi:hypothetical protein